MKKALFWGMVMTAALCAMFIFAGCPEDDSSDPPEPFKLTVKDLPDLPSGYIWGASLVDKDDVLNSIAVGIPSGPGNFKFHYSKKKADGKWTYDPNKLFSKHGEYRVAMAEVHMLSQEEKEDGIYFYCEDGKAKVVSFPVDAALSWSDTNFIKKSELEFE